MGNSSLILLFRKLKLRFLMWRVFSKDNARNAIRHPSDDVLLLIKEIPLSLILEKEITDCARFKFMPYYANIEEFTKQLRTINTSMSQKKIFPQLAPSVGTEGVSFEKFFINQTNHYLDISQWWTNWIDQIRILMVNINPEASEGVEGYSYRHTRELISNLRDTLIKIAYFVI